MTSKGDVNSRGEEEPLVRVGDGAIDRMPRLSAIFEDVGVRFEKYLQGYGEGIAVVVDPLQIMRLNDFESRYMTFGKLYAFRAAEGDFRVSVLIDGVFRAILFEMLLGSGVFEIVPDRPPTRLEERIIAYGASVIVGHFSQAFMSLGELRFSRDLASEEQGIISLGARNAVVLYSRMTFNFGAHSAQLLLAAPRSALDPFKEALSRSPGADERAIDEKWSEKLYSNLVKTEVRADVRIEARGFTLGDVARIEVGDILRLPIAPTDPIRVVAENRTLFWCTLGQKDGLYTVRLEEFSDDRESRVENLLGI